MSEDNETCLTSCHNQKSIQVDRKSQCGSKNDKIFR